LLRYDEAARFGTYVERLFAVVGNERCLPMIFDDLIADPAEQYRKFMDFCGLEPDPDVNLEARRSGKGVRFHWLQRLLKRPPVRVRNYLATDMMLHRTGAPGSSKSPKGRSRIMSVRKRLLDWNKAAAPSDPVPLEVQREIREHYRGEVDKLGRLLGRDFSHWLQPKTPQSA
jgi:hypothetical protein